MITKRQKQVLDFIKSYKEKKGYAPSLEEIKKHLKIASVSTVHYHVKSLEKLGLLRKEENLPRAIDVYENEQIIQIPLLGTIAAGQPIEAIQNVETIDIPKALLPNVNKKYYTLKVKGDSMIDDGILDGDTIIAEKKEAAENGDLIIALTEDNEATLKYFYKEKNRIRLEPRNPVYEPIFLKSVKIQGIFVNLLRQEPQQRITYPSKNTDEREKLEKLYKPFLKKRLDYRRKVTYVLNKKLPIFNWFPYKEGFSRDLVSGILKEFNIEQGGNILDPFGGCGTTALACKQLGYNSVGVDILPVAAFVANVKLLTKEDYNLQSLSKDIDNILSKQYRTPKSKFPDISIINKAFPKHVQNQLCFYKEEILKIKNEKNGNFLLLGLLSILTDVSYTSKDGQYLRLVDKKIPPVNDVLKKKLEKMFSDLQQGLTPEQSSLFEQPNKKHKEGKAKIILGDARNLNLPASNFDAIITSPPYLNRYDYSRIYALELALNFVKDAHELRKVRHDLLRSHIEVKPAQTDDVNIPALTEVLDGLEQKELNNPRIPIMIKGYFEDMMLVIKEMYRVSKKNALVALVVGNVRFEGEIIPVDLILTEIAKESGFTPIEIWITRYKGNSSQQMGRYGRIPVRESIAFWKKL